MTEIFLSLAAAVFLALPSLLVSGVLALRRSTRYFALPLIAGALAGGVAAALSPPAIISFVIAFGVVAAPLTLACGLVALIARVDRQRPSSNLPRNAFAVVLGAVALVLIGDRIDRPAAEPSARFTGVAQSLSGRLRDDGMMEERADVALDDGRRVRAVSIRPFRPGSTWAPVPKIPDRFEPQRVRVEEHRSIVTGRRSYTFIAVDSPAAGRD